MIDGRDLSSQFVGEKAPQREVCDNRAVIRESFIVQEWKERESEERRDYLFNILARKCSCKNHQRY